MIGIGFYLFDMTKLVSLSYNYVTHVIQFVDSLLFNSWRRF